MSPLEQPQRTPRTTPDPYALDEGPRRIPGEPSRPQSPADRYPDVYGHLKDPANNHPGAQPVQQERPAPFHYDTPHDPTLPVQSLMPEVVERKYRAQNEQPARTAVEIPAPIEIQDTAKEIELCGELIHDFIQDLRHGKRLADVEQQISQWTERSRRLLTATRAEATGSLSPEAVDKKCRPLEQVIEEEGRVLQWMYATGGVMNHRPSTEALFQTRTVDDSNSMKDMQVFFRTTIDQLDEIRIQVEQLTQQPVPDAADVERINVTISAAGARIADFIRSHPFAETLVSSMVFGYVRALKGLGDALAVSADNQPYAERVDQVAYQHQRVFKKGSDFFASTAAAVLMQLDEQSSVVGGKVA